MGSPFIEWLCSNKNINKPGINSISFFSVFVVYNKLYIFSFESFDNF